MDEKTILKDEFDPDAYHVSRLLEIENPAERAQAKRIYEAFFRPFYEYMGQRYEQLSEQMEQKFYGKDDDFYIVTGVCERSRLTLYEKSMLPMVPEDETEQTIEIAKIKQQLATAGRAFCYSVFMQTDTTAITELLSCKRRFRGTVYTEAGEVDAQFVVVRNTRYAEQIEKLKEIFMNNQIRWKPVSALYLNKMLDVYVVQMDDIPAEQVRRITIDFEEFSAFVKYQYVPVWNIGQIQKISGAYPLLQKDSLHYMHTIFKTQLQDTAQYLVANKTERYWGISRQDGDLLICSDKNEPVIWQLLELYEVKDMQTNREYPFFTNQTGQQTGVRLNRTKGEIEKFVDGLKLDEYVKLNDIRIQEKQLILEFENLRLGDYLQADLLEYIIQRVQWEWQEYECMGIFV